MLHAQLPPPLSARRRHILHAMGVTVYRRAGAHAPVENLPIEPLASPIEQNSPSFVPPAPIVRQPISQAPRMADAPTPIKKPSTPRTRAGSTEWVLPDADLAWFLRSKLKLHLQFALGQPDLIAAGNSDASDTALYFDLPEQALLKLGGIARLRTQWRAKRDAWLSLRMWRKSRRGD